MHKEINITCNIIIQHQTMCALGKHESSCISYTYYNSNILCNYIKKFAASITPAYSLRHLSIVSSLVSKYISSICSL